MTKSYLPGHPRPQLTRPSWQSLNGKWDFAFDDRDEGIHERWFDQFPDSREITVPYTYETSMSGIGDEGIHPVVWYKRSFTAGNDGKRLMLHFEGSDYRTTVWINGDRAGTHEGGYTRFSFDVTDLLVDGKNSITVRVEDSSDPMQPRGKQRWMKNSYGCWYVQTTGIWKSVWLESLPESYLAGVKITPRLDDMAVQIEWKISAPSYEGLSLECDISFDSRAVAKAEYTADEARGSSVMNIASQQLHQWLIMAWSPDEPNLYDIRFRIKKDGKVVDEALSYFGMRDVSVEGNHVLLNNKPIYQRLILDQGYWPGSHLTPPDEAAIILDIDRVKEMGFNGVRKHQKIEDERFAYWCDVKGLLMWCEMPSPYRFGDDMVHMYTREWISVVEQFYNHPSVVAWTPFNESWGIAEIKRVRKQQSFAEAIYHLTKSLDDQRLVISNDGWEHATTDIVTLHDYEEYADSFLARYDGQREGILSGSVFHNKSRTAFARGYEYAGQPVIITEYGGAAYAGGKNGTWGYGRAVRSEEEYLARIKKMTEAIESLTWVCGYCYTQLTDVQQEINGLMDPERNPKADVSAIRIVNGQK